MNLVLLTLQLLQIAMLSHPESTQWWPFLKSICNMQGSSLKKVAYIANACIPCKDFQAEGFLVQPGSA